MKTEKATRANNLTRDASGHFCGECGGYIESDSTWLGEDSKGTGWWNTVYQCEDCGRYETVKEKE